MSSIFISGCETENDKKRKEQALENYYQALLLNGHYKNNLDLAKNLKNSIKDRSISYIEFITEEVIKDRKKEKSKNDYLMKILFENNN